MASRDILDELLNLRLLAGGQGSPLPPMGDGALPPMDFGALPEMGTGILPEMGQAALPPIDLSSLVPSAAVPGVGMGAGAALSSPSVPLPAPAEEMGPFLEEQAMADVGSALQTGVEGVRGAAEWAAERLAPSVASDPEALTRMDAFLQMSEPPKPALPEWARTDLVTPIVSPGVEAAMEAYRKVPTSPRATAGKAAVEAENNRRRTLLLGGNPYRYMDGSGWQVERTTPDPMAWGVPAATTADVVFDKEPPGLMAQARAQAEDADTLPLLHPEISNTAWAGAAAVDGLPPALTYMTDVQFLKGKPHGLSIPKLMDIAGVAIGEDRNIIGYGNSYALMRLAGFAKDRKSFYQILQIPEVQQYLSEHKGQRLDYDIEDRSAVSAIRSQVNGELAELPMDKLEKLLLPSWKGGSPTDPRPEELLDEEGRLMTPREAALAGKGRFIGADIFLKTTSYLDDPEGVAYDIANAPLELLPQIIGNAQKRGDGMTADLALRRYTTEFVPRSLRTSEVINNIPRSAGHMMLGLLHMTGMPIFGQSLAAHITGMGQESETFRNIWNVVTPGAWDIQPVEGQSGFDTEMRYMADLETGVANMAEGFKQIPYEFQWMAHKATGGVIPMDPKKAREITRYFGQMPVALALNTLMVAQPMLKVAGGVRGLMVHRMVGLEGAFRSGLKEGAALYRQIVTIDGMMGRLVKGASSARTVRYSAAVKKWQEGLSKGDPKVIAKARARLKKWDPKELDGVARELVGKLDDLKKAVDADPAAAGASVAGLSKAEIVDKLIQHVQDVTELDKGYATSVAALGYLAEGAVGGKWTRRLWDMANKKLGKPAGFVDNSTRMLADTLKGKMPGEIRAHLAKIEQTRHALEDFGWAGEDTTRAAMMMAAGEGDVGALAHMTVAQNLTKPQLAELARFRADLKWTPSKAFVDAVNEAATGVNPKSAGQAAFDMVRAEIKERVASGEIAPPALTPAELAAAPSMTRYGPQARTPRGATITDAALDATAMDIAMEALGVDGPRPGVTEFARIYEGIEQSAMLRSLGPDGKRQLALYVMGKLKPRLVRNKAFKNATIKYKNANTGKITETPAGAVVDALEDVVTDIGSLAYDTGLAAVDAGLISLDALRAHGLQYVHNVVNQWGMKNVKGKIKQLMREAKKNADPHSVAMLEDLQRQLDMKKSKIPATEQEWARLAMDGPEFIAATYGASKPQALKQRMILDSFKYGADSADPMMAGAMGRDVHRYLRKGGPLAMEEMYRQVFHVRTLAKTLQHMDGWADDVAGVVRDMTHSPVISEATTKFLQERMGIDGHKLPTDPGARTIQISRFLDEAKAVSAAALPDGLLGMLKARGWKPASKALEKVAPARAKALALGGKDILIHPDQMAFWKYLERTKKQPKTAFGRGEQWLVRQFKQRKIVFETAPLVRDEFSNVWINGPRGGLYPYSDAWRLASKIVQTESELHRRFREMGLLDSGLSMEIGAGISDPAYGIRNRILRALDDHHAGNPLDVTGLMARAVDIRSRAVKAGGGVLGEAAGLVLDPGSTRTGGWLTYERNLVDSRARVAQATLDTVKAALEEGLVNPEIAARLDVLGRRIGLKGKVPSAGGHEAWLSAFNQHASRGAKRAGKRAKITAKADASGTPLLKRDIFEPGFKGRQAKGEHIGRQLDDVTRELLDLVPEDRMTTIIDKARKQFADYTDTPAWVDHLSKHIYGVPFIKYSAQMIPRSVSHFLNNPLMAEAYMHMSHAANTIAWNVVGGKGKWMDAYQEYQDPWQLLLPMFPGVPWATSIDGLEAIRDIGGPDMTWLTPVGGAAGVVDPLQSPLLQAAIPIAQMIAGKNPRAAFPMDWSGVGKGKLPEPVGRQLTTPGAPLPQRLTELGGSLLTQTLGHAFVPPFLVPGPGVTGTSVSSTHRPAVEALFGVDSPNKLRGPAALMMLRSLGVKAVPFGEKATNVRRAQSRVYTEQRAEERKQMGGTAHRRNYYDAAIDASGEEAKYEIGQVASRVDVGTKRRKQGLVAGEGIDTARDAELVGNARKQSGETRKRLRELGEALIDNTIRGVMQPEDAEAFFQLTPIKQREFFNAVKFDVADRRAMNARRILRGEESLGTEWEIAPAAKALGLYVDPAGPDPAAMRDEPVRPDWMKAAGDKGYLDYAPGEYGEPSQAQRFEARVKAHEARLQAKRGALETMPERYIGHPKERDPDVLLSPENQAKLYGERKKAIQDEQKKRDAELKRWLR